MSPNHLPKYTTLHSSTLRFQHLKSQTFLNFFSSLNPYIEECPFIRMTGYSVQEEMKKPNQRLVILHLSDSYFQLCSL
jgi:hypothetical protein